MTPTKRTF